MRSGKCIFFPPCAQDLSDWVNSEGSYLNREFYANEGPAAIAWVEATAKAERAGQTPALLGWIGQTWGFVNGKLITTGSNFYYPETERRQPDGRYRS